jgi:hypothetical protein
MMKSFCRWLVTQFSDLDIGVNLHAGMTPQGAPNLCTTVLERVSGQVDKYNRNLITKRYQFLTRGTDYFTAEAEARRIFEAVVNMRWQDLAPYAESGEDQYVIDTTDGNEPAYLGEDEKGRIQFSSNITLRVDRA